MIVCPRCSAPRSSRPDPCPKCGNAPAMIDGHLAWASELAHGGAGFEAQYFDTLAPLEERNFWFTARNRLLIWALSKYFPSMTSFLEVGCGTGFVLRGVGEAFPNARLVGSEVFVDGLHHAAGRVPRAEFVQMDARAMPYRDEFDVVGAFDVIEHIDDDERVLANLQRAVKQGGGLLITVPQHAWLWSAADDYGHHQRRYSAADLHRKVKSAGFEILRSTSFVSLLLPLMAASRLKQRSLEDFDPRTELRVPPLINGTLEAILTAERGLIQIGLNAPAGGSRLVVARRALPTSPEGCNQ